jgi:hypothetical protein
VSAARRRTMQDLLAAQSGIQDAADPDPALASVPAAVPAPYASADDGALGARERSDLTACEAALDNLRVAFAAAGKALQVIRDARLYRDTHGTFEEYLAERWDMSRAQAYRLIDAWPLAERLSPMGDKLNERQVRELLPVAGEHGQDAAAVVYQAVAEADGVQVTAALLHDAISVLPPGRFDPAEAVAQIRAYLAGTLTSPDPLAPDPVATFAAQAARMLRVLHKAADLGALRAAASQDPDTVRKVIADMRAVLDEIEQGTA